LNHPAKPELFMLKNLADLPCSRFFPVAGRAAPLFPLCLHRLPLFRGQMHPSSMTLHVIVVTMAMAPVATMATSESAK
jgi:hypothetical protein